MAAPAATACADWAAARVRSLAATAHLHGDRGGHRLRGASRSLGGVSMKARDRRRPGRAALRARPGAGRDDRPGEGVGLPRRRRGLGPQPRLRDGRGAGHPCAAAPTRCSAVQRPVLAPPSPAPGKTRVDARLLAGAALFGDRLGARRLLPGPGLRVAGLRDEHGAALRALDGGGHAALPALGERPRPPASRPRRPGAEPLVRARVAPWPEPSPGASRTSPAGRTGRRGRRGTPRPRRPPRSGPGSSRG